MMQKFLNSFGIVVTLVVFLGCAHEDEPLKGEPGEYLITPVGETDLAECAFAEKGLEAGLGLDFEISNRLPLPDEAYLEDRFQYDADVLLGSLHPQIAAHVAAALQRQRDHVAVCVDVLPDVATDAV